MLKSAGTSKLECTPNVVTALKSLLACALLTMLAGNQAMADLTPNPGGDLATGAGVTQVIIDDPASGNSVSINSASPEIVLNSGAGSTSIGTENSNFSGNVTAGTVTATLDAAGAAISNVGAGVAGNDAVNVNQLNAMQGASGAALNSFANEVDSRFNAVDRRIDKVEERAYAGVASVAALSAIPAPAPGKRFSIGAGLGNYSSESAVAIGIRAALTESTSVTAGISTNTASKAAANMGVGYSW